MKIIIILAILAITTTSCYSDKKCKLIEDNIKMLESTKRTIQSQPLNIQNDPAVKTSMINLEIELKSQKDLLNRKCEFFYWKSN